MTTPAPDPWAAAEQWAAGRVEWVPSSSGAVPLAVARFAAGYGTEATLAVTPGHVAIIGPVAGMTPGEARRLCALLCRGIALADSAPGAAP